MAKTNRVYHLREREKTLGFSFAVETDRNLYVSGTCAQDEEGNPVAPGDLEAQMRRAYADIATALEAHGLGFADVVREVIYVTDIEAFRAALPTRSELYGDASPPACTWVEVSRLMHPSYLIEIEVTAERH